MILLLLIFSGCERGPEAPTAAQNQQLNEMENMLDEEADRAANAS